MEKSISKKIVIVTQDFSINGGLNVLTLQIYGCVKRHFAIEPRLISLATSTSDSLSVRLFSPASWFRGVCAEKRKFGSIDYIHVGSYLAEVELLRYIRRSILDQELEGATLVILVVGTPAWAHVLSGTRVPGLILTASLARQERMSALASVQGPLRLYRILMARLVSLLDEAAISKNRYFGVLNKGLLLKIKSLASVDSIVSLIPPGVDCRKFCVARNSNDQIGQSGYLLSVGRFDDPRKNMLLALLVYKSVVERVGSEAPRLVLAGARAPTQEFWRRAGLLGVKDLIEFVRFPDEAELIKIYQNAICLLISSDEEGFCIPVIEAMACGVPVVSTSCGGPTDIIEHGVDGFLAPISDFQGLTEGILKLITCPKTRAELGDRARTKIKRHYDLEVTNKQFLDLVSSAMGQDGSLGDFLRT
jgi:glycosyltransferase involved in cell wall biosynthesis